MYRTLHTYFKCPIIDYFCENDKMYYSHYKTPSDTLKIALFLMFGNFILLCTYPTPIPTIPCWTTLSQIFLFFLFFYFWHIIL